MNKSYNELVKYKSFDERFNYVKLNCVVCDPTFGSHRYLNQRFYSSTEWKKARRDAIIRDNGCDLGIIDRPIHGKMTVHHLNPLTMADIISHSNKCLDLNNLITVSYETHRALTYGGDAPLNVGVIERQPNDTSPWRTIS